MVQQHVCRGDNDWQPGGWHRTCQRTWPTGGIGPGGADGNVRRNSLIGPGLKDMDAGLLRDVNIEGKMVFQFRAEITNVMNWVSLANPSSGNITSGSQGTITSATGTQRIIQLGGRLTF